MSCNCNNNPCSCANADCGCPPDFSIQPATLTCQGTTCEDTLSTDCIFPTQSTITSLTCTKPPTNATLTDILKLMDTKICQCGSCSGNTFQALPLFYVDSNNTVSGDGSVGNPFKTIDLAVTAVIGSGTRTTPQYTNATVYVMGGTYSTTVNIYIPSTNWTFFNGADVTFTGAGTYFIDSAGVTDGAADFKVFGWINFKTSTGGFLRNAASYVSGSVNKAIYVEAFKILGNLTGTGLPLINHNMSYGGSGTGRPFTTIKMQSMGSVISSAQQHTIYYNGSSLYIDLGGGNLFYGVDLIDAVVGSSLGNIVNYNCTDKKHPEDSRFYLKNGAIASAYNTDMILVQGRFNFLKIEDLYSIDLGTRVSKPNTFLNINTVDGNVATLETFQFILNRIILDPSAFNSSTVINYTAGGNSFNYLEMQNCNLYPGCTVYYAKIILNNRTSSGVSSAGYNIINGNLHISKIPTSSAGLSSGDVWINSGILTVA